MYNMSYSPVNVLCQDCTLLVACLSVLQCYNSLLSLSVRLYVCLVCTFLWACSFQKDGNDGECDFMHPIGAPRENYNGNCAIFKVVSFEKFHSCFKELIFIIYTFNRKTDFCSIQQADEVYMLILYQFIMLCVGHVDLVGYNRKSINIIGI